MGKRFKVGEGLVPYLDFFFQNNASLNVYMSLCMDYTTRVTVKARESLVPS